MMHVNSLQEWQRPGRGAPYPCPHDLPPDTGPVGADVRSELPVRWVRMVIQLCRIASGLRDRRSLGCPFSIIPIYTSGVDLHRISITETRVSSRSQQNCAFLAGAA